MTTEQQIILALAEQSAPIIDGTYANGHDWCVMCSGEGPNVEAHDTDCPWRLAREYMAADSAGRLRLAADEEIPMTDYRPDGPKYPEIEVHLSTGVDSNAMAVMARVTRALRPDHADEVGEFMAEAMDGDYDHVLRTCMKWVNVT